ncbi:hypothetical protein D9M68_998250 [compost metagenome]
MRQHRQHAVAHLLLETVHDREHHDQGSDTKPDAEHGNQGDKGDETIATTTSAGTSVAHANQPFEW